LGFSTPASSRPAVSRHESTDAIRAAVRPREHGFVTQKSFDVGSQRFDSGVALQRFLLQRLGDDCVEITAQRALVGLAGRACAHRGDFDLQQGVLVTHRAREPERVRPLTAQQLE
jgi:hypothetical protein